MTQPTQTNPDELLHVFATFLGMPPDSETPPVCGAALTSAYNGRGKPHCPTCDRILVDRKAQSRGIDAGNGWRILGTWKGAIYIRSERPKPIDGGCSCDYCKAHPKDTPAWDTVVVPLDAPIGERFTWTCHMPDEREFYERVRREEKRSARAAK